jgi:hypothetical protein
MEIPADLVDVASLGLVKIERFRFPARPPVQTGTWGTPPHFDHQYLRYPPGLGIEEK